MNKLGKVFGIGLALTMVMSTGANAMDISSIDQDALTYDEDQNYTQLLFNYCAAGTDKALLKAAEAEMQRNMKIEALELGYEETSFFTLLEEPEDIIQAIAVYEETGNIYGVSLYKVTATALNCREEAGLEAAKVTAFRSGTVLTFLSVAEDADGESWYQVTDGSSTGWCKADFLQPTTIEEVEASVSTAAASSGSAASAASNATAPISDYSNDDLYWLAAAITKEAGCSWLSDEHQLMVGNVVLNRVASSAYPNSIYGVLTQAGQYPWASGGARVTPTDRAYANAQRLLNGERVLPENVVYQSTATQGSGVYTSIYDATLGSTTYFCYR